MVGDCEYAQPNTFPLIYAVKKNDCEQIMRLQEHVVKLHEKNKHDPYLAAGRENLQREIKRYKKKQIKLKFSNLTDDKGNMNL